MKKAFIDQIMLGFFLFSTLVILGATVSDEYLARNKANDLNRIVKDLTRTLAKHYMYHESIADAETTANTILEQTNLGLELINKNLVTYTWRDTTGDGFPNVVTTQISGYIQDNFWFKFIDLNFFNLPPVNSTAYVTKDESDIVSITLKFGGSNAGYYNMVGTYELDDNGCIINPKLLLTNKTLYNIGDILGSYTNLNTRFFIVPNGFNIYGNQTATVDSSIEITGCANTAASMTIDGITDAGPTYFQDTNFNPDNGYDHMHEVGKTYFDDYENFINTDISYCSRYRNDGSCRTWSTRNPTWEDWVVYAADNNMDFANDPNDEYIITMEDLPDGGDKDFNDINLDTTKIRIPRTIDTQAVADATIVAE